MENPQRTKKCFVIAPIGEDGSDVRRRSDQILKHIIAPAIMDCGYDKPIRADRISEPGLITSQIIQHIVDDDLVIADLTDRNPNVFYELAIRHIIKKPIVQLIQKGEAIPFDVSQSRTIQVDHHDLDSVTACIEEMKRQIRSVEQHPAEVDNPISVAVNLQALSQSDDPIQQGNAEILSTLQNLMSMTITMHSVLNHMAHVPKAITLARSSYNLGQRVKHDKFGVGTIINFEGESLITIAFPSPVGMKKLDLGYAVLTNVDQNQNNGQGLALDEDLSDPFADN